MLLYRIAKSEYIKDLSAQGCIWSAGRWNLKGTQVLYTSGTAALAKLEVLANSPILPKNRSLLTIEVPDSASVLELNTELPANWHAYPYPPELGMIAQQWIDEGKFWIMRVPSAQMPGVPDEFNYLLNPLHEEHSQIRIVSIEPHPFDPRLK